MANSTTSTSIFANPYTKTQIFSMQGALITYSLVDSSGKPGEASAFPLACQSFSLTFGRAASPSWSINQVNGNLTKYITYSPGSGSLSLGGLFGPSTKIAALLQKLGTDCGTINFTIAPQGAVCSTTESSMGKSKNICTIQASGATLNSFSFGIQGAAGGSFTQLVVPLGFSFSDLSWKDEN